MIGWLTLSTVHYCAKFNAIPCSCLRRNLKEAQRLEAAGAEVDSSGYIGSLLEVSRSIGDFTTKAELGQGVILSEPDTYTWQLHPHHLLAVAVSDVSLNPRLGSCWSPLLLFMTHVVFKIYALCVAHGYPLPCCVGFIPPFHSPGCVERNGRHGDLQLCVQSTK